MILIFGISVFVLGFSLYFSVCFECGLDFVVKTLLSWAVAAR